MNPITRIFSTNIYSTGFLGFVDRLRIGFGRIEFILVMLSIVLAIVGLVCSEISVQEKYSMQELHQTRLKYGIAKGLTKEIINNNTMKANAETTNDTF